MTNLSTIRISGGNFKGKKLYVLNHPLLRPTLTRVREAIFNVLEHRFEFNFSRLSVLDLYSGTGAFGCEALSRGARQVIFIEKNPEIFSILEKNLTDMPNGSAFQQDVMNLGENKHPPFDIFFMDPPYHDNTLFEVLENLYKHKWIGQRTLGVMETRKEDHRPLPDFCQTICIKKYASTQVRFIKI